MDNWRGWAKKPLNWSTKMNVFTAQWVITVFVVGLMIGVLVGGAGVLSPPHRAAWVQAVGTIIAVAFAGSIAVWQVKKNHELAMERLEKERIQKYVDTAKAIRKTIKDCSHYINSDFEKVNTFKKLKDLDDDTYSTLILEAFQATFRDIRFDQIPEELILPVSSVRFAVDLFVRGISRAYEKHESYSEKTYNSFVDNVRKANSICNRSIQLIEKEIDKRLPKIC